MQKTLYKAGTAIATAALLLGSISPFALAGVDVEISGNGASSNNDANVSVSNSTGVVQSNTADIQNNVSVMANSGGNDANYNTGGDVSVTTGNASSDITVNNTANSNAASVNGCCPGSVEVKVSGNGYDSDNTANVGVVTSATVVQRNSANVENDVHSFLNTGWNDANWNTGGNVEIGTGNAKGDVDLSTKVNKNVAEISGNGSGALEVLISGNGAKTDNDAKVTVTSASQIEQTNFADILNDVLMFANSGKNDANWNTGGNVEIGTGNAEADVDVENLANFNAAEIDDCGCIVSGSVKVKDNGYDSDNTANVVLASLNWAIQKNNLDCGDGMDACASVFVKSDTGKNDANYNTEGGEPEVSTGSAGGDVEINNTANQNVVGDVDLGDIVIPPFDFDGGSLSGLLVLLFGLFS